MPLITWSNMLSVGVRDIDLQHQTLIGIMNQLAPAADDASLVVNQHAILAELMRYTQEHFGFEESLMRDIAYAEQEDHRREHQQFIDQVLAMTQRDNATGAPLSADILVFLRDWLVSHILHTDRALAQALNNRGIR